MVPEVFRVCAVGGQQTVPGDMGPTCVHAEADLDGDGVHHPGLFGVEKVTQLLRIRQVEETGHFTLILEDPLQI